MLKKLAVHLWRIVDLYLLCRGRKDVYLRKQGAVIGADCQIITDVINFGTEPYLIRIGDRVTIAKGVMLITHDGATRLFRDRFPTMNRYGNLFGPVSVGHNCFIGANALLLPNTTIGPNTIVGAGAVVKGEFPGDSVVAGVPARRIAGLEEYISKVSANMLPLQATNREELRKELEGYFSQRESPPAERSA